MLDRRDFSFQNQKSSFAQNSGQQDVTGNKILNGVIQSEFSLGNPIVGAMEINDTVAALHRFDSPQEIESGPATTKA